MKHRIESMTGFKQRNILVYLLYLLLIWLAYYLKFSKFGLYEDDYWITGIPSVSSFNELLDFIKYNFLSLERNQGRYVATFLPFIIAHINFNIGGIAAHYIFGILLVSLNAFLIFKIVSKNFPVELAILTGLIFALFPADTTKALLVHIYHLHISLVFTLLGMLSFVHGRKILGYILAFTSLMNYENAFLPFVLVPFLSQRTWDKRLFIDWIKHITIIFASFAFLIILRKLVGENTISNMDPMEMIWRTLISYAAGPLTAIYSFFNAIYITLQNLATTWYIILSVLIVIIISVFIWPSVFSSATLPSEPAFRFKSGKTISEAQLTVLKALALGFVLTIIGYSFSFTHYPPTILKGRITSVHFGGAFGIALMLAAFVRFVLTLNLKPVIRKSFAGIVILTLSLCGGYGMIIQNDYVKSWTLQKNFWSTVIKECPDIEENTVILVKDNDVPETDYVVTYSWAYPLVFELIYEFPGEWDRTPILDFVDANDLSNMTYSNGYITFKPRYPFMFDDKPEVTIENKNLIMLKLEGHKLVRVTDSLTISPGVKLPLKMSSGNNDYFPKDNLYKFIIGGN